MKTGLLRRIRRRLRSLRGAATAFPAGHFYSPVVDPATIVQARVWPHRPDVRGIDFNDASHVQILSEIFPRFMRDYDYPPALPVTPGLASFFGNNPHFSMLDAPALFVLLRAWKPRRIVEVGSGFSTLLMADVNRRFLGREVSIRCIDPYPPAFLRQGLDGIDRRIERRVQELPLEHFADLQAGDLLFIDSSHVAKTDSDVNFLFFDVLPRLAPGVLVHLHDVFLPHDYPPDWVLGENRSWNEQYLLRALLMMSSGFEVLFGCSYAFWRYPELVIAALANPDGAGYGGGSFWRRRR